jgi:hypothetical protein
MRFSHIALRNDALFHNLQLTTFTQADQATQFITRDISNDVAHESAGIILGQKQQSNARLGEWADQAPASMARP